MTTPTFRDVEQLSALLDGKLTQGDAARLEIRIKSEPQLASIYQQLSQTRSLLRQLPARRAPRNFTLTPKMAGVKAPTPRAFPVFRFASVFASLLFMFSLIANGIGTLAGPIAAAPGFYGKGGGAPEAADSAAMQPAAEAPMMAEAPAATEALAAVPAEPLPAPTLELAAPAQQESAQDNANALPTPTGELMRSVAEATVVEQSVEPSRNPVETAVVELPAAKTGGETTTPEALPVSEEPQPRQPFIPRWMQIGLLAAALLAGAVAWFVRWKAESDFSRKK